MKNLVIIGARGFGRELADWAKNCRGYGEDFCIKGFLDDKKDALDGYGDYPSIIGNVEDYEFKSDDVFVVALGSPAWKRKYAELALAKGGKPYTLIHNQATIGAHSKLGVGCLIQTGVRVSVDCEIGEFVTLLSYAVLGHDVRIGSYSHVGAFGFMGGFSSLGECVEMHPRASILPHKKIAASTIVGAGSVCIRNVSRIGTTVFGSPAKEI